MIAIPTGLTPSDLAEPEPGETRRELAGETMGTTWSVVCYAKPALRNARIRQRICALLDRIVAQMSHWREDSDLCRFNRAAAGEWFPLPGEFAHVLESALAIARLSGGAFDPALGHAADCWGFGPSGPRAAPPGAAELAPAPHDWRHVQLDPARRLAFQPGGVRLDLSSIAKGFAADAVSAALDSTGLASHLVEIGGELRGRGVKPGGQPWWVEIEPPPDCPLEARVALSGCAMATSGDYRRRFESGSATYAHTLDPRTRAPLPQPPASVTVVHASCMEADAWSTALMVLGAGDGMDLCRRHELAALWIMREPAGWRAVASPAFGAMLV